MWDPSSCRQGARLWTFWEQFVSESKQKPVFNHEWAALDFLRITQIGELQNDVNNHSTILSQMARTFLLAHVP
jgi:hypothetical protein